MTGSGYSVWSMSGESAPPITLARTRLLAVDDEPQVARFVAQAAEALGCAAESTSTAEGFRTTYKRLLPDVVVLDLNLCGADGIELIRFLAQEESSALVLVLSGFDTRVVEAAVRLGLALGLNMGEPLAKPILVDDLAAAIRNGGTAIH
jgi:DNA-binding response OmpR family regulator